MWRKFFFWVGLPVLGLLAIFSAWVFFVSEGLTGERHLRGAIGQSPQPSARVSERSTRQQSLASPAVRETSRQILFGDLHVHTTYSADAFIFSLPLLQGEGAHPPADACDFARYCAELDFWSINDHAEFLTPWQWDETRSAIRECNAVATDAKNPDLVSFLGWEWTQSAPVGMASEDKPHYGHKNVILLDTEEGRVPVRPIGDGSADAFDNSEVPSLAWNLLRAGMTIGDTPGNLRPYLDFNRYTADVRDLEACPANVPVRDLPPDCLEGAADPATLFEKLDDWGFESLVIPHGTAWGIHAPPRASLADQLTPGGHDPARQRLFEVYSGHGNSEVWADLQDTVLASDGTLRCAPPTDNYLPCCWRAGEIIEARCQDVSAQVCEDRTARARQAFVDSSPGPKAFGVVAGSTPDDWLECGQLAGSFLPALDYRPAMSAQYGLAVRRPESGPAAGAFRYGLIASSDNHKARPGAGYKELARKSFGDAYGLRQDWLNWLSSEPQEPAVEPLSAEQVRFDITRLDPGTERNASYYYTAGLVAVHADSRERTAIWEALQKRRTYATSGPRILLWFDLLNGPDGPASMGSEVETGQPPRFRVQAAGSFVQQPGCPDSTKERLSPERLERLCRGECYHPSDQRLPITGIEVVRIRPQQSADEAFADLIEDPWRTFPCPPDEQTCQVEFEDPEYTGEREFLYYVRALQTPTPTVNGDPMQCERDAQGRCLRAEFCPAGGPNFDPSDECLSPASERAWSSPIWLLPPTA